MDKEEISRNQQENAVNTVGKAKLVRIALLVGAVVIIAAVITAAVVGSLSRDFFKVRGTVTGKGSYSVSDVEALAAGDMVVAAVGDQKLTNRQLQMYYWMQVREYLDHDWTYESVFALDKTLPLDVQRQGIGLTWQQYFLESALEEYYENLSVSLMAKDAGLALDEEAAVYLEELDIYWEQLAAENNTTVEELLQKYYGPGANQEDYRVIEELYLLRDVYCMSEMEKPTLADQEAYYLEYEDYYISHGITKDGRYVNIRHILVEPEDREDNEAWEICEAEAQAILDTWLAGEKTEDSFADLAKEKSEDFSSRIDGGLLEQVYLGETVGAFDDWCFDETRKAGDYSLLKTEDGYHVVYYISSGLQWLYETENDWIYDNYYVQLARFADDHPMEVAYEDIVLGVAEIDQ